MSARRKPSPTTGHRRGPHTEPSRLEQIEDALHRLSKKVGKLSKEHKEREFTEFKNANNALAGELRQFKLGYYSELKSLREQVAGLEQKLERSWEELGKNLIQREKQADAFDEALALSNTITWELLGYLKYVGPITIEEYLKAFDGEVVDAIECVKRLEMLDMITFRNGKWMIKPHGEEALQEYGFISMEPDPA